MSKWKQARSDDPIDRHGRRVTPRDLAKKMADTRREANRQPASAQFTTSPPTRPREHRDHERRGPVSPHVRRL